MFFLKQFAYGNLSRADHVLQRRRGAGCARLLRDAPCPSHSRDRRAAGNSAGVARARYGFRHARLQWHVLPAARLASFPGTEHVTRVPARGNGLPPWRSRAHDGVQHEIRPAPHGLRPSRSLSTGKNVRTRISDHSQSVTHRQLATLRGQFVRRLPRWSLSTAAQLASSAETERTI